MTWIEVTTTGDLLDRAADERDGEAIVFPGLRLTFRELSALSDQFARSMRGLGVNAGEKVGILMPNRIEFVAAVFGALKLGAIAVPINGRFKERELSHVIAHADVRTLFTCAGPAGTVDYPQLLGQVFSDLAGGDRFALQLSRAPELRQIVDLEGATPGFMTRAEFDAAGEGVPNSDVKTAQSRVRVRDVALLMYTSGTTANPKGCLLTHEAIVRQASNVARTRFELTADDRFWDPLPLFHCGGLIPLLGCISTGATFFHAGHFDADVALRTLEEERITVAYPAFETIWLAVLNHPRFEQADLRSLRLIQNIASPTQLEYFESRIPWAAQVSSYGSTECATNLTLPLASDPPEVRMQTLGHPVPGMEITIVDPESGAPRAANEVGELCFRGYSRFDGYYKDPELTASLIDADGWFHTGDLGLLDEDGRLVYCGRLKDMLKVGGENVSAVEVEDFLLGHEGVGIVQVVGAPDSRYGEVPAAFVELRPGAVATERELIEFCLGQIASFKVPRYVRFVTEWPMSGTKIQKFVLRDQIAGELEEQGITSAPRIVGGRIELDVT